MRLIHDMIDRNRAGEAIGLPCFCTANRQVLKAVLAHAAQTGHPTVIEATCNQVNQDGGYTGMTPQAFMDWVAGMARDAGVPQEQIIFGGDHLGPNPWRDQALDVAMDKARIMVRDYVNAGFTKIHLDASMACGGEPNPSFAQIAERAAELCAVAEAHAPDPTQLVYIIGTEVPIPGGETEEPDALDVTSPARLEETISTHRAAWDAAGLEAAWGRIVSVVTQPGVDFGHTQVYPFVPAKAAPLSAAILDHAGLSFEAHSTDYQTTDALAELVTAHFFFLKVGPELTFRFREAIWALAMIEDALQLPDPSDIRAVMAAEMAAHPGDWHAYYYGSPEEIALLQNYSYSDRIRYYWPRPAVAAAVEKLMANLQDVSLPETLISQAFSGYSFGEMPVTPDALVARHIRKCITRYFVAAGHGAEPPV